VPDAPHEYLVILESRFANRALSQLNDVATITHVLKPRMILIRSDTEIHKPVTEIKGVLGIYDDTLPVLTDLSTSERMFISAWDARRKTKNRPGDQLPWDSPDFDAPDAPPDGSDES